MAKDLLIGSRVREYEILDIIGKGGMGAVYKARHIYLDEERAIKVIHSRLGDNPEHGARFIREAKMLTRLRHPNLVQIYEFGTLDEDDHFMVLEFLEGESVLHRIRHLNRIGIPESIRIVREAALGLHSAHQKGIIHRDISPDNLLLVRHEGHEITKVIDFGIGKPLLEGTLKQTATNVFMGKPEYCSPEQCGILEEGEVIDYRCDIYSLAVTFYHMLSGKLPFYSTTPQGYLVKHATEKPKLPSSHFLPGQFPPPLERVIMKALAKDRTQRQSSMEEFVRELDELVIDVDSDSTSTTASGSIPDVRSSMLMPGMSFGKRYQIEQKIGEGGMGTVYKAIDKILEVPVALKVMSTAVVHNQRMLERLKREVILARKVAHPNTCRIYDIGESDGFHYVSMQYLQGQSLAEILRQRKRLPLDEGIRIVVQMLQGLQEAHRMGVIHCGLKPQNIMVDADQRVTIMDFGISISADTSRVTQPGAPAGTPRYMAPEQFEDKKLDRRTDIYSVGVILYEVFTGKVPFEATTPMAVIFAHMKSTPIRPTEIVSDLPPELEKIILKCLEKGPEYRYQEVHEILRGLKELEKQFPMAEGDSQTHTTSSVPVERAETMAADGALQVTPSPVALTPTTSPPTFLSRTKSWWTVAVVIALVAGGWLLRGVNSHNILVSSSPSLQKPKPANAEAGLNIVSVNALPWAEFALTPVRKEIRLTEDQMRPRATPCVLSVPAGEYTLKLKNQQQEIQKNITVRPGIVNSFVFTMPSYDIDRAIAKASAIPE